MTIKGNVNIEGDGDEIDDLIAALNVKDISIGSGTTRFFKNGSGWLANKAIQWDVSGNTTFSGTFVSENKKTLNRIEMDAYHGHFKMFGPSHVSDEDWDLPAPGTTTAEELLSIDFQVDADALSRVCVVEVQGSYGNMIGLDGTYGVFAIGDPYTTQGGYVEHHKQTLVGNDGLYIHVDNAYSWNESTQSWITYDARVEITEGGIRIQGPTKTCIITQDGVSVS